MSQARGMRVRLAGATDVGLVREHNEDSFLVVDLHTETSDLAQLREYTLDGPGTLLLVCDGMGGAAAGEVASAMAVQGMRRALVRDFGPQPLAGETAAGAAAAIPIDVAAPEPPADPAAEARTEPAAVASAPEIAVTPEAGKLQGGEGGTQAADAATPAAASAADNVPPTAPLRGAASPSGGGDDSHPAAAPVVPAPAPEAKAEPAAPETKTEPVAPEDKTEPSPEAVTPAVLEAATPAVLEAATPAVLEAATPAVLEAATPAGDENNQAEVMALARRLRQAVYAVNLEIFAAACADMTKAGMGTTLTGLLLQPGRVLVAQVGDSRAYLWRQGKLTQITHDQSLVNQLLDTGQITPDQAKLFEHSNVILQALGVQEDVEVLVSSETLRRGDRILLCSDGLVGVVSDEEIQEVLGLSDNLDDTVHTLIDLARSAGGPDNITVIVAEVGGDALPLPSAEEAVAYRPLTLDPPAYPALRFDSAEVAAGAYYGRPETQQPLSLGAVLSIAWVIGLLLAGLVVSFLLYPRRVPARLPPRGGICYFVADRAGLDILVDGELRGVTNLPGIELRVGPGEHSVVLRDRGGLEPILGERVHMRVSPGQRCALRLRAPRPDPAPFPLDSIDPE